MEDWTYGVDVIDVVQAPMRVEGVIDDEWATESL